MITQEQEDKFKELITFLDCALTGKPYKDCLHTFTSVRHSILQFLQGDLYYLSDGGYSRLFWSMWHKGGENAIGVASESLQEVKDAFPRCKELVQDLNDFLVTIEKEYV